MIPALHCRTFYTAATYFIYFSRNTTNSPNRFQKQKPALILFAQVGLDHDAACQAITSGIACKHCYANDFVCHVIARLVAVKITFYNSAVIYKRGIDFICLSCM